jgi:hypothetical protein
MLAIVAGFDTVAFSQEESDAFTLTSDPERPRNYWIPPLASFLLPGFDQWWEGQYEYAGFYTGVGIAGVAYSDYNAEKLEKEYEAIGYDDLPEYEKRNLATHGERERKVSYGGQIYSAMGGMSTYHSFRTAVRSRKAMGQFGFLTKEESPQDLALAPFQFEHLQNKSTWIPLTIAVGLAALKVSSIEDEDGYKRDAYSNSDAFYTGGISYNAGVWEEATFRGWLMPSLRESWGSDLWSNVATATVFGLLHLSEENRFPIAQLGLGYYLGYIAQENEWTLSESIFLHAWWDVIALAAEYQVLGTEKAEDLVVWLPPYQLAF